MPLSPYATRVQSVTELTRSIRGLLETEFAFVTVSGEISNLSKPYSGHFYFTLKDENAQIKAVLFKGQQKYLNVPLENGSQVICRGRISVYEPRGDYQIIADTVESFGTGNLQIAFEQLKKKLEGEGLFHAERKKELPFLPEKIFLVTSPKGAALFDFLRIAESRFPAVPIEIYPVRVQGDGAASEIARALSTINDREKNGVIVLCRGGGSLEDLWTFNEEQVARAIYVSHLPVVSAVGHEVDFTIADFVADHRSPTPTAAARDVLPDRESLKRRVENLSVQIRSVLQRKVEIFRQKLKFEKQRLGDPSAILNHYRLLLDNMQLNMSNALISSLNQQKSQLREINSRLDMQNPARKVMHHRHVVETLSERLVILIRMQMERKQKRFEKNAALLDAVSPLSVLGRGYGIIRRKPDGRVVRSPSQVSPGDTLQITVHKGEFSATVTDTEKEP